MQCSAGLGLEAPCCPAKSSSPRSLKRNFISASSRSGCPLLVRTASLARNGHDLLDQPLQCGIPFTLGDADDIQLKGAEVERQIEQS